MENRGFGYLSVCTNVRSVAAQRLQRLVDREEVFVCLTVFLSFAPELEVQQVPII